MQPTLLFIDKTLAQLTGLAILSHSLRLPSGPQGAEGDPVNRGGGTQMDRDAHTNTQTHTHSLTHMSYVIPSALSPSCL